MIANRIRELGGIYAVAVYAHAVMSNHLYADSERAVLQARLNTRKGATDEKFRIGIILAFASGESSRVIAECMQTTAQTLSKGLGALRRSDLRDWVMPHARAVGAA